MASVLIYSIFTAACGFSQTIAQLAVFRILLGIGMGGEWASGAALVSETWPAEHRGKALGFMQSAWRGLRRRRDRDRDRAPALGLARRLLRRRAPGVLHLWVQKRVKEPEMWRAARSAPAALARPLTDIFRGRCGASTVAVTVNERLHHVRLVGFNLWLPAYLSLPAQQGGSVCRPR